MRAALVQHTEESLDEAIDRAMPALLEADLPISDAPVPDYAELTAEYVETGRQTGRVGTMKGAPYTATLPALSSLPG